MRQRPRRVDSAAQMIQAVSSGTYSAERLMEETLQRALQSSSLNCFLWIDADRALARARDIDKTRRSGARLPPLAGLPIVVKDNIDVAGMPTSLGTRTLAEELVHRDAGIIQALVAAGAIIVGKTNMHELASGISGINAARGDVVHPFLPDHIPGGSSSGTAAAVAAGVIPLGLGTDTGASVRLPAAFCGVAGFRPGAGHDRSRSRYPLDGVALISPTRDAVGLIAQNVGDIALVDAVLMGDTPVAPLDTLAGIRIAVPRDPFWTNLDKKVAAAMRAFLSKVEEAGVECIEVAMPNILEEAVAAGFPIASWEMLNAMDGYLRERRSAFSAEQVFSGVLSTDVAAIVEEARQVGHEAYLTALHKLRPQIGARFDAIFEHHAVDALLFPTVPMPPPLQPFAQQADHVHANALFRRLISHCEPATLAHLPAISLPLASTEGLPIGVELQGRVGKDRQLLALSLAFAREFSADVE